MGWIHMCVLWGSDGSVGAVGVVNLETFNCVCQFSSIWNEMMTLLWSCQGGDPREQERETETETEIERRERKRSSKRWGLPFAPDTGKHSSSIHGGCHSEVIATLGILATLT